MRDAYQILKLNKEQIKSLDAENPEKTDKVIRDMFGKQRLLTYGDPDGIIRDSGNGQSQLRMEDSIERFSRMIAADIEAILAYDCVRNKSQRDKYSKELTRGLDFLRIDRIKGQTERYIDSVLLQNARVNSKSAKVTAYSLVDVIRPVNEEEYSKQESQILDKKIQDRCRANLESYARAIRGSIIKGINTGYFDKETAIQESLMQLKFKWAFEKIKDKESRREYNIDFDYSLSNETLKKMNYYNPENFSYEDIDNPKKYIIDYDSKGYYLRESSGRNEEILALRQGKKVIWNSREIGYKFMGAGLGLSEYTVERVKDGKINTAKVLSDDLRIIEMTKVRNTRDVLDQEYSDFVLGKIFSDASINGCRKYRFGYVGNAVINQRGEYIQDFRPQTLRAAKEFSSRINERGE